MDYSTTYTTTSTSTMSSGAAITLGLIGLVVAVIVIAGMWKVFTKAGKPGWAAIIPIYNGWVLMEIAGKPGWWALVGLLGIIPLVGFIASIAYFVLYVIASLEVAKRFGQSAMFAVFGLILVPIVGWPMLGFGKAKYKGGSATPAAPAAPAAPTPPAAPAA